MQHGHGGVDARHRLRLPRVEPRGLAQPAADGLRLLAQVDDLRTLHPRPTETSPARPTVPSQVKLAKCEADGVFSAANEGPFAGKAANHIPTIHCDGTAVTIKVPGSEDEVSRAPAPDETAGSSGPRAATRSIERADASEGRRRRAWRARGSPRPPKRWGDTLPKPPIDDGAGRAWGGSRARRRWSAASPQVRLRQEGGRRHFLQGDQSRRGARPASSDPRAPTPTRARPQEATITFTARKGDYITAFAAFATAGVWSSEKTLVA